MLRLIGRTLVVLGLMTVVMMSWANAQLVVNGGFENGNTGWTMQDGTCGPNTGNPYNAPAYTGSLLGFSPHTGQYAMWMGASGCVAGVSQILNTVAGQQYSLQFWLALFSDQPLTSNIFYMFINYPYNASALYSGQVSNTAWTEYNLSFTGTGSDEISFYAQNDPSGTLLDDVSVTATVPEPMTLMMVATGLLGLGGVGIRRRRKFAE